MIRLLNPDSVAPPIGAYSHAVEIPAGARILQISGQVGIAADGTIPPDAAGQSAIVWQNILALLAAAEMAACDITKMTSYLLAPGDLAAYGVARNAALDGHRPASTLVYVSALVKPELRVEVEVTAARA